VDLAEGFQPDDLKGNMPPGRDSGSLFDRTSPVAAGN
jgi:hypothetical protein